MNSIKRSINQANSRQGRHPPPVSNARNAASISRNEFIALATQSSTSSLPGKASVRSRQHAGIPPSSSPSTSLQRNACSTGRRAPSSNSQTRKQPSRPLFCSRSKLIDCRLTRIEETALWTVAVNTTDTVASQHSRHPSGHTGAGLLPQFLRTAHLKIYRPKSS